MQREYLQKSSLFFLTKSSSKHVMLWKNKCKMFQPAKCVLKITAIIKEYIISIIILFIGIVGRDNAGADNLYRTTKTRCY